MVRRVGFIFTCYLDYFRNNSSILLITLSLFFLGSGIYFGNFLPYKVLLDNRMELMNELFFACHLCMNMCYTDFVTTPEAQFMAGWIHVGVLTFQVFMNFLPIILAVGIGARMITKKVYIRIMHWIDTKKSNQ